MAMFKLESMKIYTKRQNFPEQSFMKWLRHELHEKKLIVLFHYAEARYIAEEITPAVIDNWTSEKPVIISAQTGTGKNYFVQNELLPKVIDENRGKKHLVLIVSNRIALTRQSKFDFAKRISEFTGNRKYLEEIEQYYTNEGVDKCYIELGAVTVCSYHQLMERNLLDKRQYKYVICDECHFFTSDSTFNPNTDEMLKEIVSKAQNSIRIYLSATPEIACESIISEEFNFAKNKSDDFVKYVENFTPTSEYRIDKFKEHPQYKNSYEVQQMIECEQSKTYKTTEFYYFKRNYDYLNIVGTYSKNDDMIEQITSSESKWIVFVQSNSEGKDFEEKLRKAGISCCFISRSEIDASKKTAQDNFDNDTTDLEKYNPAEEYNYLIAKETFRPKVLITTSIIDNGINIKNEGIKKISDKVLNVAINTLDRTSFLQMLGRIRVSDDTKIKLYIKEHSTGEVKQAINRNAELLVKILANDFQNLEGKQKNFDPQLFKYSNDTEIFSTYNECAVTQLINLISALVRIIRNNEPDYKIKLGDEMEATKERVYLAYKDNQNESWDKAFSRSVVDLLESDSGAQTRQMYIEEDIRRGVPKDFYYYTTDDTFTKFMFSEMIPNAIRGEMQDYYNACVRVLESIEKKIFDSLVVKEEKLREVELSLAERIKLLKNRFPKRYIPNSIENIKSFENKIEHYKQLADESDISDMLSAQLQWIEKFDSNIEQTGFKNVGNSISQPEVSEDQSLEDFIESILVTDEEICDNRSDDKNPRVLKFKFLKSKGIAKGSHLENQISQKFFGGKSITNILRGKKQQAKLKVNEIICEIQSFVTDKSDHKTHYLFVKVASEN